MASLEIPFKVVRAGGRPPARAYPDDAAYDLSSAVDCRLAPQQRATIPTGIAVALPPGTAALTTPRSGLAAAHGITIVNSPGLIDPGYRGEIAVVLLNTDLHETFEIKAGDRVAQLLIVSLSDVRMVESDDLDNTARGTRGFGSSGLAGSSRPL